MFDVKQNTYVDYSVTGVMPIKEKYGFRIKLVMSDGSKKVIQRAGYTTKKIANKERDKVLGQLASNTFVLESSLKLQDFLNEWLEAVMRSRITYQTYTSYRNAIKHVNSEIGDMPLILVKPSTLTKLLKEHSKKSYSVAKMMKIVLKTSMAYAVNRDLLTENPMLNVTLPKKSESNAEPFVGKVLTLEQMKLLLEKSKETPIHLHVMFACLLGLRKSEINGVKYSDIDYVNRTITIQRQIGKTLTENGEELSSSTKDEIPLKTFASNRVLPIPDVLFEAILEERQIYEKKKNRRQSIFSDDGYVFCGYNGSPRTRGYVYTHFKKLLEDCGLPDMRWHDLRASYCTLLMSENINPKAISTLMGHRQPLITADVYNRKINVYSALEQLEPIIAELIEEHKEKILSQQVLEEVLKIQEEIIETIFSVKKV